MIKKYSLVYQAGIANVFFHPKAAPIRLAKGNRVRVLQGTFRNCEDFCRGLIEAGCEVTPAWCNMAGDVSLQDWNYAQFENAPFSENFRMVKSASLSR